MLEDLSLLRNLSAAMNMQTRYEIKTNCFKNTWISNLNW